MAVKMKDLRDEELFIGHKACQGCAATVAVRLALKVLGPRTFAALPPSCMATVGFNYPNMPFFMNAMIVPFASTGAVISGLRAGVDALGLEDCNVVAFAGDGGTADIGIQALSGAVDRGDNIIYICYDNEAYMNTGVQESGLTPYGAKTTTSPVGSKIHGAIHRKKNLFEIIAAHDIPYAATACVGYPDDFIAKVEKAKNCKGPSFIHIMAPCPTGWGLATEKTMTVAKQAVDCGLWFLAEYEDGQFHLNRDPKEFIPVEDYLMQQSRFKHLDKDAIAYITAQRDKKWERIRSAWK